MRAIAAALALFACGPPDWNGLLEGSQGPGVAEQCGLQPGRLELHAVLVSGGQSCAAGWTTYWELDERAQIVVPERMQGCCPAAVAVAGCAVSLSLECPAELWRFALSLDSREGAVVTTTPEETCRYEARLARPSEP